jgi:multidrug efflux pump subunit AcrB
MSPLDQKEIQEKLKEVEASVWVKRQLGFAVDCTVVGLVCILLFLWNGFGAWSMGLGTFIGIPLVVVGVILYLSVVGFDLKRSGLLALDMRN